MSEKTIKILQLYPRDMNIYGDSGNTLVLSQRVKWHGYTPELLSYNPGDTFPSDVDILIGGGGQDSGQDKIQEDLLTLRDQLHTLANSGTPMLVICGLYQLFGNFFKINDDHTITGIGIFDIETHAGTERLI
ncbi:glutamine amidotransferase, partial [Candidatus Saccharibacteria bacterium]|nr:glutamine amidotransferase [Candidatus Saccharibacteria bacterium]